MAIDVFCIFEYLHGRCMSVHLDIKSVFNARLEFTPMASREDGVSLVADSVERIANIAFLNTVSIKNA